MYNSQEIREQIIILLKEKNISINKILTDCGYNSNLINDMRKGKMPSADKIVAIAQYLEVSVEYLMGVKRQNDKSYIIDTKINRELEELAILYTQLNAQHRRQVMEYVKFLKTIKE